MLISAVSIFMPDASMFASWIQQLSKIEWHIKQKATALDQHALLLLRSVPGIGLILSLTILCEIHDIDRFPRVQDFASYARLVKCKHESAGKTYGTGGGKIGNAYLKWAFSEAAVLFLKAAALGHSVRSLFLKSGYLLPIDRVEAHLCYAADSCSMSQPGNTRTAG